jgi:hypothetical protein
MSYTGALTGGGKLVASRQQAINSTATSISSLEKRLKANKKRKTNMTLRQRIRAWLYADENDTPEVAIREDDDNELRFDHEQAIHFAVIPANGGRIVQLRYYDRQKDRHYNKLHLITPDEDLPTSLAHILQIETLSR